MLNKEGAGRFRAFSPAGIAPHDLPWFILAQPLGAGRAALLARLLFDRLTRATFVANATFVAAIRR
jgi:hypothetical protein